MSTFKNISIGLLLILNNLVSLHAQNTNLDTVKLEIEEAAIKEQNAFKSGDCKQVMDLMEPEITFLANGRKAPSKQMVEKFCNSIPRPFKKTIIDRLDISPLTIDTGYVVRTLEYPNDDTTKMKEYVTKIWRKTNGVWKISHLHSTVKKVPISK